MGAYRPSKGYGANPLFHGKLRNFFCPCGSQQKVKKCCGRIMYIPQKYIEGLSEWAAQIQQGETEYGRERLKQLMAEYRAANQQNLIINQEETDVGNNQTA